MKRIKLLSSCLFILFASFCGFALYSSPLAVKPTLCQNIFLGGFAPWDSGCFYRSYYQNENKLNQILYEKSHLDYFAERGGLAHTILWYRSVFHQRFREVLNTSFDGISEMHWAYTAADPKQIDIQLAYFQYLINKKQNQRAQESLDFYCKTYLPPRRKNVAKTLGALILDQNVPLSMQLCRSHVGLDN